MVNIPEPQNPDQGQVVTQTTVNTTANTTPSVRYIESIRAGLVLVALLGTIGLTWKYPQALTPALVVLSGAIGGYFGVAQNNKPPV